MNDTRLSVIVWNEFIQERLDPAARANYPDGLHTVIANSLRHAAKSNKDVAAMDVSTATLGEPDHGLSDTRLLACDVLVWCGSLAHERVADEVVDRIHRRVLEGMGLIVLHAGLASKICRKLLGVNWSLEPTTTGKKERLCIVEASHPIAAGVDKNFELPAGKMCRENFDLIQPDSTVLASRLDGGDAFRTGCCWARGFGRLFYFQPGDLASPAFHDANVQRILSNAVHWVAPRFRFNDSRRDIQELECVDNEMKLEDPASAIRSDRVRPYLVGGKTLVNPGRRKAEAGKLGLIGTATQLQPLFPTLISHLQENSCEQRDGSGLRHRSRRRLIA